MKLGSLEQLVACRGERIELRIEVETLQPDSLSRSAAAAGAEYHELVVSFPADEVVSRVAPLPRRDSPGK